MEPSHQNFFYLHRKELVFTILFIVFFFTGQFLYYISRPYVSPLLTNILTAKVSSNIINIITPQERSYSYGAVIKSGEVGIDISEGCEGIEGVILISAAILAFYSGFKQKFLGILVGSLIIYLSNLFRIISLYYIHKYKPEIFDILHIFVGQTFIIFIGLLYFIVWTNTFAGRKEHAG